MGGYDNIEEIDVTEKVEVPDDASVLIATPNYTNTYSSETYSSHINCVTQWTKWGLDFMITIHGRNFVHFARTQACQAAIDGGYTHIFWVDDDAVIDPNILPKFLAHDKDVVVCPYPMRRSPFQPGVLSATRFLCPDCREVTLIDEDMTPPMEVDCEHCEGTSMRNFHDHKSYRNFRISDLNQGLVQIDGGGTHAMLIKTETLTKCRGLAPPKPGEDELNWSYPPELVDMLNTLDDEQKDVIDHYLGDVPDQQLTLQEEDDGGKPYFMMPKAGTEDMYWCYRAKCKGVEVWCDTDEWANHVGFAPLITKDFTVQAEKSIEKPVAERNKIELTPTGIGRDHTSIRKDKTVNLL